VQFRHTEPRFAPAPVKHRATDEQSVLTVYLDRIRAIYIGLSSRDDIRASATIDSWALNFQGWHNGILDPLHGTMLFITVFASLLSVPHPKINTPSFTAWSLPQDAMRCGMQVYLLANQVGVIIGYHRTTPLSLNNGQHPVVYGRLNTN
jgi:hypothetical protein